MNIIFVQVMEKAAEKIENELGCLKLLSVDESEKVGALTSQVKNLHIKLSEEVGNAQALDDYIHSIKDLARKISREQMRQKSVLEHGEKSLKLRQEDVTQAFKDCEVNSSSQQK